MPPQEPRKSDAPQLRDEYRSYRILQGCPGIPQAYYYGTEGLHNVLCIDLLGPNLEDLFDLVRLSPSLFTSNAHSKYLSSLISCSPLIVWTEIHCEDGRYARQTDGELFLVSVRLGAILEILTVLVITD